MGGRSPKPWEAAAPLWVAELWKAAEAWEAALPLGAADLWEAVEAWEAAAPLGVVELLEAAEEPAVPREPTGLRELPEGLEISEPGTACVWLSAAPAWKTVLA